MRRAASRAGKPPGEDIADDLPIRIGAVDLRPKAQIGAEGIRPAQPGALPSQKDDDPGIGHGVDGVEQPDPPEPDAEGRTHTLQPAFGQGVRQRRRLLRQMTVTARADNPSETKICTSAPGGICARSVSMADSDSRLPRSGRANTSRGRAPRCRR